MRKWGSPDERGNPYRATTSTAPGLLLVASRHRDVDHLLMAVFAILPALVGVPLVLPAPTRHSDRRVEDSAVSRWR
ncbi:MAG TPA: hypothetical protein VJ757_07455 [Pseudonocardiaceae bacterium]|nr:hypothetical protein [Pseudonocardiaceae bacterium]